jgi:hypothetical protein
MTRLEDIKAGVSVSGIAPEGTVEVVSVEWYGDGAIQVIYRDGGGAVKNRLLYRDEESSLSVGASGVPGPSTATGRCSGWSRRR